MRLKILFLLALGLFLFTSCSNEELDPTLEIYVTTKASQNWTMADLYVGTVRFAIEFGDGEQGWGSLQRYNGADFDVSLQDEQSTLIFNDRHFDIESLLGLKLNLSNPKLVDSAGNIYDVTIPFYDYRALDIPIALENDKRYRLDFVLDFDNLIEDQNGGLVLTPEYDILIEEF